MDVDRDGGGGEPACLPELQQESICRQQQEEEKVCTGSTGLCIRVIMKCSTCCWFSSGVSRCDSSFPLKSVESYIKQFILRAGRPAGFLRIWREPSSLVSSVVSNGAE